MQVLDDADTVCKFYFIFFLILCSDINGPSVSINPIYLTHNRTSLNCTDSKQNQGLLPDSKSCSFRVKYLNFNESGPHWCYFKFYPEIPGIIMDYSQKTNKTNISVYGIVINLLVT